MNSVSELRFQAADAFFLGQCSFGGTQLSGQPVLGGQQDRCKIAVRRRGFGQPEPCCQRMPQQCHACLPRGFLAKPETRLGGVAGPDKPAQRLGAQMAFECLADGLHLIPAGGVGLFITFELFPGDAAGSTRFQVRPRVLRFPERCGENRILFPGSLRTRSQQTAEFLHAGGLSASGLNCCCLSAWVLGSLLVSVLGGTVRIRCGVLRPALHFVARPAHHVLAFGPGVLQFALSDGKIRLELGFDVLEPRCAEQFLQQR